MSTGRKNEQYTLTKYDKSRWQKRKVTQQHRTQGGNRAERKAWKRTVSILIVVPPILQIGSDKSRQRRGLKISTVSYAAHAIYQHRGRTKCHLCYFGVLVDSNSSIAGGTESTGCTYRGRSARSAKVCPGGRNDILYGRASIWRNSSFARCLLRLTLHTGLRAVFNDRMK